LVDAVARHVRNADKLHADDTPLPVLAPRLGKTKTARLWTYVRDDRPSGSQDPPAVWFAYTPDRKGAHPQRHLKDFTGVLQADGFAGFNALYESGRIREAACWAHARRKFYELEQARPSPISGEALRRIGALYAIEETIRGKPPQERLGGTAGTGQAAARCGGKVVARDGHHAVAQIRYDSGHPVCAQSLAGIDALL
jgi:hypothetical protein